MLNSPTSLEMRARVLGLDREVPLLDGRRVTYVNLDNAASTPPLVASTRAHLSDELPELTTSTWRPSMTHMVRGTRPRRKPK